MAQISAELGIHIVTLHNWRKAWRLQGEVVPASEKEPEGWSAADKFTVVLGCPWSKRAMRMLRTLGIHHQITTISGDAERRALEQRTGRGSLPQVFIKGQIIGGYDDLAERQGRGWLERLRSV